MTRLIALVLLVVSLAAVPTAFADDSTAPATPTTPEAGTVTTGAAHPVLRLRHRMKLVAVRLRKHCAQNTTDPRCSEAAAKIAERLAKLDEAVQARIAKIQETCASPTADDRCQNADKRIERLQKIDQRIQALEQKVQDWLSGSTPTGTSDASLDQAADGLGQLVDSNS